MNREKFEAFPEIARMVSCDEIKWCDVYSWYHTDNTDENSIYHVAWLNGAWFAFCEQEKRIEKALGFTEDVHSECWQDSINCIREVLK